MSNKLTIKVNVQTDKAIKKIEVLEFIKRMLEENKAPDVLGISFALLQHNMFDDEGKVKSEYLMVSDNEATSIVADFSIKTAFTELGQHIEDYIEGICSPENFKKLYEGDWDEAIKREQQSKEE